VAERIPATAVYVAKTFQARCTIPGCDFTGELLGSYQEANFDRQAHLDEHRKAAAE
jgi:hypothetical protein